MVIDLDLPQTIYPIDPILMELVDPVRIYPDKPRRKKIFVSGKYRDPRGEWYVECNIRAAEKEAQFIWMNGGAAFCPHLNTAHFGGLLPDEVWLEGDIEFLMVCDAIYMLPNWETSDGAKDERQKAYDLGMPVLYDHADLLHFLGVIK